MLIALAEPDVGHSSQQFLADWAGSPELPALESPGLRTAKLPGWLAAFQTVHGFEAWQQHGAWISRHWAFLGADVAARFRTASIIEPGQAEGARDVLRAARQHICSAVFGGVLILPSASSVAPLLPESALGGDAIERIRRATVQLTCVAGIAGLPAVNVPLSIDAVGYLGLDRVFTGNMTGNVVILGMALFSAEELPVLGPSIALAGFIIGAVIARSLLKPETAGWNKRTTALLTVDEVAMAAAASVLFGHAPQAGGPVTLGITGAMATDMGVQAATARHLSVNDATTVVVTSTLTGLAADSRLGGGTGAHRGRRLGSVVLILAGAAAGAPLLHVHVGLGVLLTAVLTIAMALTGGIARAHSQGGTLAAGEPAAPAEFPASLARR
ncbi:DUF1275 family protein [Arthrobacter sp. UYCu723]